MTNNLCVILGDQLSSNISSLKNFKKNQDKILMMEVFNEATYANHHKKKLVLVFSAMRHFAKELQEKGVSVTYSKINKSQDNFTKELSNQCKKIQPKRIVITHPGEYRVLQEIKKWEKVLKIPVSIVDDDRFFCTIEEFKKWTERRKEPNLHDYLVPPRPHFKGSRSLRARITRT